VKECPLPTTRTGPTLSRKAATSSASLEGRDISFGSARTHPDQFDQAAIRS
jgi:hypothetical protein